MVSQGARSPPLPPGAPGSPSRRGKPAGPPGPAAGPRVGEGWRAGARAGSPAPGGGGRGGRCPGALTPVAHLAAATWRRRAPRGRPGGKPPRRLRSAPGRGARAGPRSHFVLCKSHESGFPRAGAAMPAAAAERARAPLCRLREGRRRLPRAPWPVPGLQPRRPPRAPAPSSLPSLRSASRLNLALRAPWSEGGRMGGEHPALVAAWGRGTARGPRPPLPAPGLASARPREPLFCSLHGARRASLRAVRAPRARIQSGSVWPICHGRDRVLSRPRGG